MSRKLQIKRGAKAALPPLAPGELAMTTDEKTLYYGTGAENIPVARKEHTHTADDVGLGKTLTFTGAATGTFDGAADKTINIPEAGGRRTCRFVVGTATAGWATKDCDYLCDGTDDQVEINAAIQALPTTGGEVVILDGTYNIAAAIMVNKEKTKLSGNGTATVLKRMWNSTDSQGVVHVTANNCNFVNFVVDGNRLAYTSANNCGIYLIGNSGCTITKNTLKDNNYNITLSASTDNIVADNRLTGGNSLGIDMSRSSKNIMRENIFSNNGTGIRFFSRCSNNIVTGNAFFENKCGIDTVLIMTSSPNRNNGITGNVFIDNGTSILVRDCVNSTITDNTCVRGTGQPSDYTAEQHTIRVLAPANNNLIANNLIMGKNYVADGGTSNTFVNNKYN